MRHLTARDYTVMPWVNGRGTTTELIRVDRDGRLLWRLSMAQVVEDGPFSRLPGVQRNLTVIEGPGFDLVGPGVRLPARPFEPVAFSGGAEISAEGVIGPTVDFNVMTASTLPLPRVLAAPSAALFDPAGAVLCLFAVQATFVDGHPVGRHDLMMTTAPCESTGPVLAIWIVED